MASEGLADNVDRARAQAEAQLRFVNRASNLVLTQRQRQDFLAQGFQAAEGAGEAWDKDQEIITARIERNHQRLRLFIKHALPGHSYGFDEYCVLSDEVRAGIYETVGSEEPDWRADPTKVYKTQIPGTDVMIHQNRMSMAFGRLLPEGLEIEMPDLLFPDYLRATQPEAFEELSALFK